jgi:hypothetical protein
VRRYLLTPRGRVANLALAMLLAGVMAYAVQRALGSGGAAWSVPAIVAALLFGTLAHHPWTYATIALGGMFAMAAGLNHGRGAMVITSLLLVGVAMYARSQILERTAAAPDDAPQP